MVVGVITGDVTLSLFDDFILKELNIISSQQPVNPVQDTAYYHFTQQRNRQMVLEYLEKGDLRVDELLTHRFNYKQVPELYAMLKKTRDSDSSDTKAANREMIGVLIEWN